ncbi:MAG: YpmS family protein [Liquorilactobacillus nagelii]|uniref:YpmS family protein n=1 Tax=Liquorilactobacillus nagelii TaxID=82688 RepID=UPI0039E8AD2F
MRRAKEPTKKVGRKYNYWKWAFIGLLAIILGSGLYLIQQITAPNQQEQAITQKISSLKQQATINVEMNKRQLNAAINYYLKRQQKHEKIKYQFYVDQAAVLVGTTKLLGQSVSFSLYTEPTVTSQGNILLHAKSVAIGTLNAPPKFILSYIQKNYNLGKWVTINSKQETIRLNLRQIKGFHGISVRAQKIDLTKNQFKFKVDVPFKK